MQTTTSRRETISAYLSPRDAATLRARAEAADRSLAGEIRHALRDYLGGGRRTDDHEEKDRC